MAKKIKASKKDFTVGMLPTSRKAQFKDLLTHRYRTFLTIGLLSILFFIPYFLLLIYRDTGLFSIASQNLSQEEELQSISSLMLIFNIGTVPCMMIFFLGLAGFSKIMKQIIYGEPVFFKDDFLDGIKQNWKPYIFIGFIVSLFTGIASMFQYIFLNPVIMVIPFGVNIVLLLPIVFVSLFISTIYSNPMSVTLKNAILIYFRKLPAILGLFISLYAVYVLRFVSIPLVTYLGSLIYLVFILPVAFFGGFIYHIQIFDEAVNKEQYPEFYRKGLYTPDSEN